MLIDQLTAVDASTLEFAQKRSAESIPGDDGGFAAYLAQVMDPTRDRPASSSETQEQHNSSHSSHETGQPDDVRHATSLDKTSQEKMSRKETPPGDTTRSPASEEPSDATAGSTAKTEKGTVQDARNGETRKSRAPLKKRGNVPPTLTAVKNRELLPKGEASARPTDGLRQSATTSGLEGPATGDLKKNLQAMRDRIIQEPDNVASPVPSVEIDVVVPVRSANEARRPDDESEKSGEKKKRLAQSIKQATLDAAERNRTEPGEEPVRSTRTKISVRDLRPNPDSQSGREASEANAPLDWGAGDLSRNDNASGRMEGPDFAADVRSGSLSVTHQAKGTTVPTEGSLESLRHALSEKTNAEIVKSARLVVRGAETGEIKLNLRPETLGNVRIVLHLEEGHIAGRIFVENVNVKEVFEQNLEDLVRAFNASGLETGSLDVMLDDSTGEDQGRSTGTPGQAIRQLEAAVPLVQTFVDDHELIDLVV